MISSNDSKGYFLYMYPYMIHDFGVFITFNMFESKVLKTANINPSQIMPNWWSFVKAFEILCRSLEISIIVGFFFSYYGTKLDSNGDLVTLGAILGRVLLSPHSNNYKNKKDKFMIVIRQNDLFMVMFDDNDGDRFLFDWTENLMVINRFNYE